MNKNFQYVKNYLVPVNDAVYDDVAKNSTVTTFYGVYPNETRSIDWKYAKKEPFDELISE